MFFFLFTGDAAAISLAKKSVAASRHPIIEEIGDKFGKDGKGQQQQKGTLEDLGNLKNSGRAVIEAVGSPQHHGVQAVPVLRGEELSSPFPL